MRECQRTLEEVNNFRVAEAKVYLQCGDGRGLGKNRGLMRPEQWQPSPSM